ncbi:hypothetical protein K1719_009431 [Acacia pycnantha]|nr:hypothetical protein K1719_009431 [Acacia pycnantha]
MVYMSNRGKKAQGSRFYTEEVRQGLHVLSNAQLDSPWPKSERLCFCFQQELAKYGEKTIPLNHIASSAMKDSVKTTPPVLPHISS